MHDVVSMIIESGEPAFAGFDPDHRLELSPTAVTRWGRDGFVQCVPDLRGHLIADRAAATRQAA